jgi:RNA polymerase sigma-70 factor, ECF subfamily
MGPARTAANFVERPGEVMSEQLQSATSVSLLVRLAQPSDGEAWRRFAALYSPLLFFWLQRLGCPASDASDVVQDILIEVFRNIGRYRKQPGKRFRGWLWTITRNKAWERLRRNAGAPLDGIAPEHEVADERNDLDDWIEANYREYLVDRALRLMKSDFEATTWQACWDHVVEGRDPAQIARALGITVNAVYLAKSRVLRRLRQELDGLID